MCNETGIPEFLKFQIPGIAMVMMVTSRARSLHDPTQQICVTCNSNSEEPSRVHYAK